MSLGKEQPVPASTVAPHPAALLPTLWWAVRAWGLGVVLHRYVKAGPGGKLLVCGINLRCSSREFQGSAAWQLHVSPGGMRKVSSDGKALAASQLLSHPPFAPSKQQLTSEHASATGQCKWGGCLVGMSPFAPSKQLTNEDASAIGQCK
eukprot:scaffold170143_cov19-Tisochrysis_lutea.AAC.1